MSTKTAIIISFTSIGISILVAIFSFFRVRAASRAIRQASFIQKFSTFNIASQAMMNNPEYLYSVHGLDRSVPEEEARNVAYLGLLMDCFQCEYEWKFKGKFKKIVKMQKKKPTFLTRILGINNNQQRWFLMKNLFYNELDADYLEAIDSLIDLLKSKATKEQQA